MDDGRPTGLSIAVNILTEEYACVKDRLNRTIERLSNLMTVNIEHFESRLS